MFGVRARHEPHARDGRPHPRAPVPRSHRRPRDADGARRSAASSSTRRRRRIATRSTSSTRRGSGAGARTCASRWAGSGSTTSPRATGATRRSTSGTIARSACRASRPSGTDRRRAAHVGRGRPRRGRALRAGPDAHREHVGRAGDHDGARGAAALVRHRRALRPALVEDSATSRCCPAFASSRTRATARRSRRASPRHGASRSSSRCAPPAVAASARRARRSSASRSTTRPSATRSTATTTLKPEKSWGVNADVTVTPDKTDDVPRLGLRELGRRPHRSRPR